jgi:integrase
MAKTGKRSFATIRRLPSGRHQVRYTGPDGIRHTAPRTFHTRLDAEEYAAARRREIDAQTWTPASAVQMPLFGVYAHNWLRDRQVAGRPLKDRTRALYASILERHLLPVFGAMPINAIRSSDVRAWYAQTLVDYPTARAHAYALLRTILGSAVDDELLEVNPARIRGAGNSKRVHRVTVATIAELDALAAKMPPQYALMVPFASWCALRFGETVELRRGDIDLGAGVIRIRRGAVRVNGAYRTTTPKSGAGIRDVAIPPHLLDAVCDHLVNHTGAGARALLFPAPGGGHLHPSMHQAHWYKARAAIGREDLRWHDLRHTGAVLAASTGASLAELMQRLGHSTAQAALRYQHAVAGRDREIAALLSKLAANEAVTP